MASLCASALWTPLSPDAGVDSITGNDYNPCNSKLVQFPVIEVGYKQT